MSRPRKLPQALFEHDFNHLMREETHAKTRIRWLGMMNLKKGRSYLETAELLGVEKETVLGWMKRFKKEGLDGLRESPRSGAKRKLSSDQDAAFKTAVIALQEDREGGSIIGRDVQQLLSDQFKVICGLSSVYNYLHRVELSWVTVRSKHPKQSPEKQDNFKKTFKR